MSSFLLDSDVIIWHLRGRTGVQEMLRDLQVFGLPACSAISVLEVQLGVKKGEEEKTDHFFRSLRVIDVDREIASKAAQLVRESKGKGTTVDLPDAIIAGTCILNRMTLVTYNIRHYAFEELRLHPVPPM
jgi:predicted nucleic acid-binding protein